VLAFALLHFRYFINFFFFWVFLYRFLLLCFFLFF